MKVYFSHGMGSGPRGFKIKHLATIAEGRGFEVESVDYTDSMDAEFRVERLLSILQQERNFFVLVGSSMGGYVSLVALETVNPSGVFLMAPVLAMPGYKHQQYKSRSPHIEIVHNWDDDIIPPQHSIDYARAADCSLHLISGDHGLNGSLEQVAVLFVEFLRRVGEDKSRVPDH